QDFHTQSSRLCAQDPLRPPAAVVPSAGDRGKQSQDGPRRPSPGLLIDELSPSVPGGRQAARKTDPGRRPPGRKPPPDSTRAADRPSLLSSHLLPSGTDSTARGSPRSRITPTTRERFSLRSTLPAARQTRHRGSAPTR